MNNINKTYFTSNDLQSQIDGKWKTTKKRGAVKIQCTADKDNHFLVNIVTQTAKQRFLSGILTVCTLGACRNRFKTEEKVTYNSIDFNTVKSLVTQCYQAIIAGKSIEAQRLMAVTKITQTTAKVVGEIIQTFMAPANRILLPQQFYENIVQPKQAALSEIDERSRIFLKKMMVPIEQMMNGFKPPILSQQIDALAELVGDPEFRRKLLEGIALPFILILIQEFDAIKTSIVDQLSA